MCGSLFSRAEEYTDDVPQGVKSPLYIPLIFLFCCRIFASCSCPCRRALFSSSVGAHRNTNATPGRTSALPAIPNVKGIPAAAKDPAGHSGASRNSQSCVHYNAMNEAGLQNPLWGQSDHLEPYGLQSFSCRPIWDPDNARFSPCAEPYLKAIPAIIITLIAVYYILDSAIPQWRPRWMRPFVVEHPISQVSELPLDEKRPSLRWAIVLLTLTALGCASEVSLLISGPLSFIAVIQPLSWLTAAVLIAVKRPRTCPLLLLLYFIAVAVINLLHTKQTSNVSNHLVEAGAHYASLSAAGTACFTILLMPFRESYAVSSDVSAVGQQPDGANRSPEDNLRLWQFLSVSWMVPLISIGKIRKLNEPDVWLLPFEFQHKRLDEQFRRLKGSVVRRLLQANGIDICIITLIGIVQMICSFSTPVLLQKLLQVTKDPSIPRRISLKYALFTLIMRLIAAQSQVLNVWFGRRCYERSRGEMVMMVHEKALSRKNIFGQELQSDASKSDNESDALLEEEGESMEENQSLKRKKSRYCLWMLPWSRNTPASEKTDIKANEAASMGKILNLIRGDVYEVAQRFWEIDALVDKPLGLIVAVALVWNLFGPSCLLGVVTVLVAQVFTAVVIRILVIWERRRRTATDTRLQITSQFVEAIRHLRWYGWQNHWLRQVMDARRDELHLRIITSMWSILIRTISAFASGLFPVVALYSYTVLSGHPMGIDIIFPALQLFTMLETRLRDIPNLINVLINASVAMGRIENFMSEPDKETEKSADATSDSDFIRFESCSYAWPGILKPVLSDVSLTIPKGLTIVTGKVGSGKTAFLQAILGELDKIDGSCHIPNDMLGYCAQTPWLQSMSIRDNILFSSPYDERRYKQVLAACALVQDLSNFKNGDLTFIGENGTGLSGGQKARVALARAVYSNAKILLLDDPLSALDFNTAESVVRKCFAGPLMQERIIVLATHRTMLVRHIAEQIVEFDEGRTTIRDKNSILAALGEENVGLDGRNTSPKDDDGEAADGHLDDGGSAVVSDKFIEEEHRAEWGVQSKVYWAYVKAGKLRWWSVLVAVLAIYRLSTVAQSWFLKDWGESYENSSAALFAMHPLRHTSSVLPNGFNSYLPPAAEDVRPWLWAFFIITSFQTTMLLLGSLVMVVIVYYAAKTMFEQVMVHVSHATFRYFDVTPVGRLMNRLTSDIGVVDGNISIQFQQISFLAITWVTSVVVIASVTPIFLIFSLLMTGAFVYIFLQFLPCSQSLRRLEMVSLSPLLSNFGELLHGLTTIRAFHAEKRFQNRVIEVVDKFQGMDHFYWSLQSWLMYRFESLSAISTFLLTALALYTGVSAGLIAFVLIAAENFVSSTHGLCKQYGQLQMDFVSVERVDELRHVEQEPSGDIDPPASWPRYGADIVLEDVTIRYAPHLDPSLSNISLRIPGGSSTAIIGRTGSGKSTLALSLLNAVRPESGSITIDNIDLAHVNTQALRHRVTFVAQEPVLFPGSIRLNLDPAGDYTDTECADVLHRICSSRHGWTLDTQVEERGRNLSHGQRQLIGLSRAVLRRSAIVILDEATASIDQETSLEIQQIIREELRESTVVSVAHRLEAIKDANYCVVLDQGRVVRQAYVGEERGEVLS